MTAALGVLVARQAGGTYARALMRLSVRATEHDADMSAVKDSLLAWAPTGSPASRVMTLLDSLGFVSPKDGHERRATYQQQLSGYGNVVVAQVPYEDPWLSVNRVVCDAPAIRVVFRFDGSWRLESVVATTARGCL